MPSEVSDEGFDVFSAPSPKHFKLIGESGEAFEEGVRDIALCEKRRTDFACLAQHQALFVQQAVV